MREIPINLTAAEIRAYQGGETVLRRKVKNPHYYGCPTGDCPHWDQKDCDQYMRGTDVVADSPFGAPGDVLIFKEKWASPEIDKTRAGRIAYDADGVCGCWTNSGEDFICHGRVIQASGYHECFPKEGATTRGLGDYTDLRSGEYPSYKYGWRSSHVMPRWAVRYTPRVLSSTVERRVDTWEWVAVVEAVQP